VAVGASETGRRRAIVVTKALVRVGAPTSDSPAEAVVGTGLADKGSGCEGGARECAVADDRFAAEVRAGASPLRANTQRPNGRKQKRGDGAWQLPDRRRSSSAARATARLARVIEAEAVEPARRDVETIPVSCMGEPQLTLAGSLRAGCECVSRVRASHLPSRRQLIGSDYRLATPMRFALPGSARRGRQADAARPPSDGRRRATPERYR
jgi:hypothetical protein